MRRLRIILLASLGILACGQPCEDVGCAGFYAIDVFADPEQLNGELAFDLTVDTIPVSCVVQLPLQPKTTMLTCSESFVWVGFEAGTAPTFSVVVNREASEVRVSVARGEQQLGTVTYNPVFHDVAQGNACEPCRGARRGKLSITDEGELVKE